MLMPNTTLRLPFLIQIESLLPPNLYPCSRRFPILNRLYRDKGANTISKIVAVSPSTLYLIQNVPVTSPTNLPLISFLDAPTMSTFLPAGFLFQNPKSDIVVSLDAPVSPMNAFGSSSNFAVALKSV